MTTEDTADVADLFSASTLARLRQPLTPAPIMADTDAAIETLLVTLADDLARDWWGNLALSMPASVQVWRGLWKTGTARGFAAGRWCCEMPASACSWGAQSLGFLLEVGRVAFTADTLRLLHGTKVQLVFDVVDQVSTETVDAGTEIAADTLAWVTGAAAVAGVAVAVAAYDLSAGQ